MKKYFCNIKDYPDYPVLTYGGLSIKLINCFFLGRDIKTIKETKKISKKYFLSMMFLGEKSWNELQEYIKNYEHLER